MTERLPSYVPRGSNTTFPYRRRCVRCNTMKPMRKAITWPRFICADCRKVGEKR